MLDAGTVVRDLQDMRDGGHLSDALLRKAVRSIAAADDRYDWVGVYLVGEEELWLHNYIGEPTDYAKIPMGASVSGRAVADRQNANVKDVAKEEGYLANAPETQS